MRKEQNPSNGTKPHRTPSRPNIPHPKRNQSQNHIKNGHIQMPTSVPKATVKENNPTDHKKEMMQEMNQNQAIFRNVEKLDFTACGCLGGVEILNKQACVPVLVKNNVIIVACTKFGSGRAVAFANDNFYNKQFDKNWIIFLKNIINWLTKNKPACPTRPIKILMNTITPDTISPDTIITSSLQRAYLNVQMTFDAKYSETDLSQFDCVFVKDFSNKLFNQLDCQKIVRYVRNGGGLFMVLKGWLYKCYGEGKIQKDWINQCLFNKVLTPMGLRFSQKSTKFDQITLNPKQTLKILDPVLKPYTKQLNPLFIEQYSSQISDKLKQDKEIIISGVGDISLPGIAVSSFNYPSQNFIPIYTQNKKDYCIAGRYGKGKIFAFGHTDPYHKKFLTQASMKTLLQNVITWMVGKIQCVKIGLLHEGQWNIDTFSLTNIGLNVHIKYLKNKEDLNNFNIVCVTYHSKYPGTMTPEFNRKIRQFVQNGGNLFFVSHGWVWQTYGQYKKNNSLVYEKDFASYVLLKQFQIRLNKDCYKISNPFRPSFNVPQAKDQQLQNFLIKDLLNVLKNSQKISFNSSQQYIQAALSKIKSTEPRQFESICSIELYYELVDAFVESRFNIEKHYDQLSFADAFICNVFNLMDALSYACPPHICRALPPSLNTYPGTASKRLISKTVQVYKNRNKIVYSGLYINPGEVVKVKHNNDQDQLVGVELKVNFNRDLTNRNNGKLKRFVNIARTYKIKSNQFLIASPHGGIIYFQIRNRSQSNRPLTFTFEGAYEGLYWNENLHSYADFQKIKKIDCPFFAIQTKRMILMGRGKKVLSGLNIKIQKLCNFWNTVVGIYKDYRGIQQYPFEKQAYFSDTNIILGSMHSGTPVMTHQDATFQILGVGDKLFKNATWGLYHELGHNHQDYKWTIRPQMTEVTCNIYSLLLIKQIHGISIAQNMWVERNGQSSVKKYFEKPQRTLKDYGQDPFLGLAMFACLMEQFGYQIFSEVHKRYNKITLPNESTETKVDMLVEQVSAVIGQNVWYYFKSWGLPVTQSSLTKVSNKKKYLCKRFPFITQNI